MTQPKKGISSTGKEMHYSVGALIEQKGKVLLIDRVHIPLGFAGPAGHVDEGETPEQALKREVKEETGLEVTTMKQLFEEEINWNACGHGGEAHYWYVYACEVEGKVKRNKEEIKAIGWYTSEEIRKLKLEQVWVYWLKRLKII